MTSTTVHWRLFEFHSLLTFRAEIKTFGYLQRGNVITTAVYPRVFVILTTVDIRSKAQSWTSQKHEKKKNNETSSSACGQPCIMNRQEHNRSLVRDVAWRKKKKIRRIVDKLPRREFMSITV